MEEKTEWLLELDMCCSRYSNKETLRQIILSSALWQPLQGSAAVLPASCGRSGFLSVAGRPTYKCQLSQSLIRAMSGRHRSFSLG